MIERNRSPYGPRGNFLFGLATLVEGLIRVCSLGYYHGNHKYTPLAVSRDLTKKHFKKLRDTHE